MHILFKLIMLYLNPLIYLDKHIYELKMINFRLFYKLLAKKIFKTYRYWYQKMLLEPMNSVPLFSKRFDICHAPPVYIWTYVQGNLSTVLQLLKRQRSVLYFCIQWWMDLLISLKKSFFCLYIFSESCAWNETASFTQNVTF